MHPRLKEIEGHIADLWADVRPCSCPTGQPRRSDDVGAASAFPLERFPAKHAPRLEPGWIPVRVRKTRQIRNPEPRFDSVETQTALGRELMNAPIGLIVRVQLVPDRRLIVASQRREAMCQLRK